VQGFPGPAQLKALNREIGRYVAEVVPKLPPEAVYYENKNNPKSLKRLNQMHQFDPYFAQLRERPQVIELAELLLDGPVVPHTVLWLNKPKNGQHTPPHQDGYYHKIDPPEAITMWLALDPVNDSNGCVRYISGSHRRGMRPHAKTGVLGFSQGIADFGEANRAHEVAAHAQPGDLRVHHCMTIHLADGNRSDRPRRAMGLFQFSARSKDDPEARAVREAQIAADLADPGKI